MPLTQRMNPGSEGGAGGGASAGALRGEEQGTKEAGAARPGRRGPRARRCPACKQAFSGEARFCPFDGDALVETDDYNPSADPLIGQLIDNRYEVIDVLGEGGMGTVYEVRHKTLGRRFALKVLRRDLCDAELSLRFIQEAKAAAAIGHPNIVAVSDFGELRQGEGRAVPYFVMEMLTGISLAALLRVDKTLAPPRAAAILLQCAAGLTAAHAAGVIHRDLKPDNVFLARSGDREFVKLLDFGVAKMVGTGRLTRAGMVFGTPHYMSPEQAAGQNVDHRADVYALGVILYECFAGRVPFEADDYMGVLTKHMFATPEPIEQVAPDASHLGALGPIAMRCLAKDPQDRFASMAELSAAIELAMNDPSRSASLIGSVDRGPSLLRQLPDAASSPSHGGKAPADRARLVPVLAGVGALCLAAILAVGWIALRRGPAEEGAASRDAPASPPSAAAPHDTAASAPSQTPSGALPQALPQAPPEAPLTAAAAATASSLGAAEAPSSAAKPAPSPSRGVPSPSHTAAPRSGKPRPRKSGELVDPWAR